MGELYGIQNQQSMLKVAIANLQILLSSEIEKNNLLSTENTSLQDMLNRINLDMIKLSLDKVNAADELEALTKVLREELERTQTSLVSVTTENDTNKKMVLDLDTSLQDMQGRFDNLSESYSKLVTDNKTLIDVLNAQAKNAAVVHEDLLNRHEQYASAMQHVHYDLRTKVAEQAAYIEKLTAALMDNKVPYSHYRNSNRKLT